MAQSEILLGALPYGADIIIGQELETGTFTIGGTTYTRYVKVLALNPFTSIPSGQTSVQINTPHGITGIVGMLSVRGYMTYNSIYASLPYYNPAQTVASIGIYVNGANIVCTATYDWSHYTGYAILEYYK